MLTLKWCKCCIGPKAEAWPSSIPSKIVSSKYSFYSAFHLGSTWTWDNSFSCTSCCGSACIQVNLESRTLSFSGIPAQHLPKGDIKRGGGGRKTHHSKESDIPSSHARCLSSIFPVSIALSCSTASGFCPGTWTKDYHLHCRLVFGFT